MIKFAFKVGLATATVYYVRDQGVWRNSTESVQTYERLKETVRPYVQEVTSQIPIELPELPQSESLSSLVKQSWNAGVMATFKFLSELPDTANTWTKRGIDKALENEEFRNFINSFSSKSVESQPVIEKK
ncbi:hypothetical protein NQ317_014428 [Molorchus minor]|uniref:MICOS complex subunit MIC13 n=1 Tax=Molorchus minor TaxID=1323400 RepID=A0ABQ9K8B8_9CUCU|nr:hypothetical protein NQ317_014428 [Molorchus minor]